MASSKSSGVTLPVQVEPGVKAKDESYKMKHLCLHLYKQAALKQGNNFFSGWVCVKCGKLADNPSHVVSYDKSEGENTGDS